ncbi:hypothetical protein FRC05_000285 [Tulasnella sp. 425]|nr:hypothetical protein FRC05_000285 [Tulasnella sp. 425]
MYHALEVLRQQFNIGEEHDLHFLQPSLRGGISGPTPIEESSWEGVARTAESIQVNLSRPVDRSPDHETSSDGSQASFSQASFASQVYMPSTSPSIRLRTWPGHGVTSVAQAGPSGSSLVRRPNPTASRSLTVTSPIEASDIATNSQRSRSADMIIANTRSSSPESIETRPPPYTRVAEGETNRKITFTIVNEDNEVVTLSAKRSLRALRILETACNVFKLDVSKCRLEHAGRIYGRGDVERLTLASLDVENGDRLGVSWDCTTIHSEVWLYHRESSSSGSSSVDGSNQVRISVSLSPQWRFDEVTPEVPIDKRTSSSKITWHVDSRPDGSLTIANLPGTVDRLSWESRSKPVILSARHPPEESNTEAPNTPVSISAEADAPSPQTLHLPALRKQAVTDSWPSLLMHIICVIALSPVVFILDQLAALGLRRGRKRQQTTFNVRMPQRTQDLDLLEPPRCLNDENSVLLRGIDVRNYLEDVLGSAGIPKTIWVDFVGRVCPSIARNRYVAMRLIPAEDYRQLSSLRVAPEPDALMRVLLMYAGIPSTNLGDWPKAAGRAEARDHDAWRDILCHSVPVVKDEGGFTALELACVQLYLDEE